MDLKLKRRTTITHIEEINKIIDEPHSDGSDILEGVPDVDLTESQIEEKVIKAEDGDRRRGGSIIETDD